MQVRGFWLVSKDLRAAEARSLEHRAPPTPKPGEEAEPA